MKDSEFIELLNLYLDHEISEADAARLEAEVQGNPARREVYQQYCRMQKACKMLASDFATEPVSAPEPKVVAFNPATAAARTARGSGFYVVGAFAAAAACVAVIFVGRDRQESKLLATEAATQPAIAQVVPQASAQAAKVTIVAAEASAPRAARTEKLQPMLVGDPLLLRNTQQPEAMLAQAMQQTNDHLAWLNTVQVAPMPQRVSADSLRFDVRPTSLQPEDRALGRRAPGEANVEMAAIRFIK